MTEFHISKGYVEVPTENIQVQSDGLFYEYYIVDADGVYVPDLAKIQEAELSILVATGESLVKGYIQDVIDIYNKTYSINFENVDSCSKYVGIDTYTHQQFCIDILSFNAEVWEASRAIQLDVVNGSIEAPTDDEFIAMLPVYNGVV